MTGGAPGGEGVLRLLLRRDRWFGLGALILFTILAWLYLVDGAGMEMGGSQALTDMAGRMATPQPWTPSYALLVFVMWWVMMVAMMLPSAAPMILLFGLVRRRHAERGGGVASTWIFALGYLTVWGAFSLLATGLQWRLDRLAVMSPMMVTTSTVLGGTILLAAGVYQLTPLKDACLRHCRGPVEFLASHWRPGASGAWRMGVEHGLFCLGCCWVLMALLFYGGVMNLYWIIGLTLYVLLEKLLPRGRLLSRLGGLGLIVWGMVVLLAT